MLLVHDVLQLQQRRWLRLVLCLVGGRHGILPVRLCKRPERGHMRQLEVDE
jgi:hypothetical protein